MTTLSLEILGTRFAIATDDARWHNFVATAWAPFVVPIPQTPDHEAWIRTAGPGWGLSWDGLSPANSPDPWLLAVELRNRMFSTAVRGTDRFFCLHAAVLVRDGSALLLVGAQGQGKTTLTLEMTRRGWRYFSDDLAPITDHGSVVACPKPLHVKDLDRWPELGRGWIDQGWPPAPTSSFLVPAPSDVGGPAEQAKPHTIALLRRRKGGESGLERLSAAQATGLLAAHGGHLRPLSTANLAQAEVLARSCYVAEVSFTARDEAMDALELLLRESGWWRTM